MMLSDTLQMQIICQKQQWFQFYDRIKQIKTSYKVQIKSSRLF